MFWAPVRQARVYLGTAVLVAILGLVLAAFLLLRETDHFILGQLYFNQVDSLVYGYDIEKAEYHYKKAVAAGEGDSNDFLWYQLGRTHFIQGEFEEALAAFDTQLALHGDVRPNVYYMIGLTYGFKARRYNTQIDWELAAEHFAKYVEYDYYAPWPRVDLAWVLFSQGRYEEMGPVLSVALAEEPENPWVLNMYGLYELNHDHTPEGKANALAYFARAAYFASSLTNEEWGEVYPGNDPVVWGEGRERFNAIINKNIELAQAQ